MYRTLMLLLIIPVIAIAQSKDAPKPPVGVFKLRSLGPALTSGRVVGFAVHPHDKATYCVAVA